MHSSISSPQLEQARRNAKRISKQQAIPLHQAQDSIAQSHGFSNWSQFAKGHTKPIVRVKAVKTKRYYLHGDLEEGALASYYCAECDLFVDAAHFTHPHQVDHGERALTALERFYEGPGEFDTSYHRPKSAPNTLQSAMAAIVAARNVKEASRSNFHRWLEQQRGRSGPVGDLADDVMSDQQFPSDATSLTKAMRYLDGKWASRNAKRALAQAWGEFRSSILSATTTG